NSREVRRVARQIYANMNHCRSEAVATGKSEHLRLDQRENKMEACGGRWAVFTDRAFIERIEGGSHAGGGSPTFTFCSNGSASGGRVLMARRRDPLGIRLAVRLTPLLGQPFVEE